MGLQNSFGTQVPCHGTLNSGGRVELWVKENHGRYANYGRDLRSRRVVRWETDIGSQHPLYAELQLATCWACNMFRPNVRPKYTYSPSCVCGGIRAQFFNSRGKSMLRGKPTGCFGCLSGRPRLLFRRLLFYSVCFLGKMVTPEQMRLFHLSIADH